MKLKKKSIIKENIKNDLNKPELICQTYDTIHETEITSYHANSGWPRPFLFFFFFNLISWFQGFSFYVILVLFLYKILSTYYHCLFFYHLIKIKPTYILIQIYWLNMFPRLKDQWSVIITLHMATKLRELDSQRGNKLALIYTSKWQQQKIKITAFQVNWQWRITKTKYKWHHKTTRWTPARVFFWSDFLTTSGRDSC
jgi:hypothetical protein